MRLFIAVQVPEYVKASAAALKNLLSQADADIKWVEHENYHLTLKFLGEVDEKKIVNIKEKLDKAARATAPFNLGLSRPGCFPNRKRPRVLYLGISGQSNMFLELGRRIDAGLSDLGFKSDPRRQLHLTLGRFRSDNNKEKLLSLFDQLQQEIDLRAFRVGGFYLMESQLSKQGAVYEVIEIFKMAE